jgi:hypothetical protein
MDGQKILIFMVCFNVLLYILGFQLVQGDLLHLYDTSSLDLNKQSTNINFNADVKAKFPKNAENSGSTLINTFIDGLSLIWALALLIFNLLTSPIAIFNILHPVIAILIGIPFSFMFLLATVKFIRGADL